MDLVNWGFNALDSIFSQRKRGTGEPQCPDGTFAAGYVMDAWKSWRLLCLSVLSIEDSEDAYLFGFMIAGLSLIGMGLIFVVFNLGKAIRAIHRLSLELKERFVAMDGTLGELQERLKRSSVDTQRRLDYIANQTAGLCMRVESGNTMAPRRAKSFSFEARDLEDGTK